MSHNSQKIGYYYLIVSFCFLLFQAINLLLSNNLTYSNQLDGLMGCLFIGVNGAAYYIIIEEAQSEVYSKKLAYLQLAFLILINTFIHLKIHTNSLFTYLILGNFVLLLGNLGYTLWQSHIYTATGMILLLSFLLAGLIYISELFNFHSHRPISYWQQWFTDLWVEGIWELMMSSILGFVLIKITSSRENIELWLYAMVGFCFIIGLLGNPSYTFAHYQTSWFIFSPKYTKEILHILASLIFLGMITSALRAEKKNLNNTTL